MTRRPKIIVVGAGVSGSLVAIRAAEGGAEVMVLSRLSLRRAPSCAHRQGISAALDTKGEGDSPGLHARETILCGDFLSHQRAVRAMCDAAPGIVGLFDRMGVSFDRSPEGIVELTRVPGASRCRTALARGSTGRQLLAALAAQLQRCVSGERLKLFENWEFLSLVQDGAGACRGVVAVDTRNMEVRAFPSSAVVICTGGFAGLFGRAGASPASDGSAIAACAEAGAALANPEFVQIHPIALVGAHRRHVIPEAALLRGASAFVPREERAIEILGTGAWARDAVIFPDEAARQVEACLRDPARGSVRFDPSSLPPEWERRHLGELLPLARGLADDDGDDDESSWRVAPAVGRTLGGLWVDENHATSIPRLFAAGEAACLYHGASALGGNELLADAFGGMVAGRFALERGLGMAQGADDVPASLLEAAKTREEDESAALARQEGVERAHELWAALGEVMAASMFLERDNRELDAAAAKIEELRDRCSHAALADRSEWSNLELVAMRRVRRALILAKVAVAAARRRDESRGSHAKSDHPNRDDERWLAVTRAVWTGGAVSFESERIDTSQLKPEAHRRRLKAARNLGG